MNKRKIPRRGKRTRAKPISLYGIPFEEAVEGLLKTEPPPKKARKRKAKK